jgi:hypothetical protein
VTEIAAQPERAKGLRDFSILKRRDIKKKGQIVKLDQRK